MNPLTISTGSKHRIYTAKYFSDGNTIISYSFDNKSFTLWNACNGNFIKQINNCINCINFSIHPNNNIILGHDYSNIMLWNVLTGERINSIDCYFNKNCIHTVIFNPNGDTFLSTHADHRIVVWNTLDYTQHYVINTYLPVYSIEFNSDGTKFVTGGDYGRVLIWNASTYQLIQEINDPLYMVNKCIPGIFLASFNFNATKIVTCSTYDIVQVWNIIDKQQLFSIDCPQNPDFGNYVSFSPDGTLILVLNSHEIQLWNSNTGQCIQKNTEYVVHSAHFSPDGTKIVACNHYEIFIIPIKISGKRTKQALHDYEKNIIESSNELINEQLIESSNEQLIESSNGLINEQLIESSNELLNELSNGLCNEQLNELSNKISLNEIVNCPDLNDLDLTGLDN